MSRDQHRNALQPGYMIKWYEIRKILGQGGFGITYLAIDTNLDQEVAIKEYLPIELAVREGDHTVHPASGAHGEQFQWGKDRFISEARTLAKFKHPNIVRVFSVFEAMNTAYMIMEYERGESLQDKLSGRRTMEEAELMKLAFPLMDGLKCVHDAGFIHRDIKPPNIFIREDGSPVLLDFGSARQAMGSATKTLTALVSPGYAPFEQYYSKSDEQGAWTDIYGLGATLYRAASGVAPLDAMDRSRSLIDATPDTFIATASMTEGRYSQRFQRAVDHALQFKAVDRPQSVDEWRREFGIDEAVAALDQHEQDSTTTLPTRIVRRPGKSEERRSRTLPAVAAGVLVLAAAAWFALPLLMAPGQPPAEMATAAADPTAAAADKGQVPGATAPEASAATTPGADTTVAADPAGDTTTAGEAAASSEVPGPEPVDEQAQRVAELFAAAEAERARQAEQAQAALLEQQHAAHEQARLEEQQRLAAEQATREAEAQARHDEEQRRLQAKLEEQQRVAAERTEQARKAEEARKEEQRRLAVQAAERERVAQEALAEKEAVAAQEASRLASAEAARKACEAGKSVPLAEPVRAGSGAYFAAVAVGEGNGWGEAWGYETRADAEQVALAGCAQNDTGCAVQVWSNDCVAFAAGPRGAAGWSWGASLNEARQKAIGFCESHSTCCTLMTAYCADELGQ